MKSTAYPDIRNNLRSGDIIAFSGHSAISTLIKVATNSSVSHIGIVLSTYTEHNTFNIIQLIESTSLGDFTGVTLTRLSARCATYDGTIWALPLSAESRKSFKSIPFLSFMASQRGKPYDAPQAIQSALDKLVPDTPKDLSRLFCSELAVAGLQVAGVLSETLNPSEMTPSDVARLPIYEDAYHLSGPKLEIS